MRDGRLSKFRPPSAASDGDQLILDHLKLVQAIAASVQANLPVHVEADDLIDDGTCGLIEAARRYDATRNIPFAAFAKHRIRGAMLDGLRRVDPASRNLREKAKRIDAVTRDLGDRLGRTPTAEEVQAKSGISTRCLDRLCASMVAVGPASERSGNLAGYGPDPKADDATSTDAVVARAELKNALRGAIRLLPHRDRQIVVLYHWRGATMQEIGRMFHINESRVSQIHKRALDHLATTLRSSGITSTGSILR